MDNAKHIFSIEALELTDNSLLVEIKSSMELRLLAAALAEAIHRNPALLFVLIESLEIARDKFKQEI